MSRKTPVNSRSRARQQVMQMLFARDFSPEETHLITASADVMDGVVPESYAVDLLQGVLDNQERIDDLIGQTSENWTLSRMSGTDRAILRTAVYELLYRPDVPSGVSINEAVELAQSFGGEDESYRFVNGILGKIADRMESGSLGADEACGADGAGEAEVADDDGEAEGAGDGAGEEQPGEA